MDMSLKIAVAGKGGVGKTTLAGGLALGSERARKAHRHGYGRGEGPSREYRNMCFKHIEWDELKVPEWEK